jgi:GNAT superfamily N-acetyltransferase
MTPFVPIRPRTADDHVALVELLTEVNALDGYPPLVPPDKLGAFLLGHPALSAWVAEIDGAIVGHVALHERSLDETMTAASAALGVREDELGVVARLFIGPAGRGQGLGEALLDISTADARARGLVPILDTWQELTNAVALYDRCGWRRLAALPALIRDETIDIYVYAAPDPAS